MVHLIGLIVVALSAFASTPKFEKANNSSGYSVKDLSGKDHFEVSLTLPSDTAEETLRHYAIRSIGEECFARGFQYFDISVETRTRHVGFCFTTTERKGLSVTFGSEGLKAEPKRFIIEDLNNKASTQLKVGDEIKSVAGKSVTSMAQIKSQLFVATRKVNSLKLKLIRDGKELEVTEPVAVITGATLGKEDLEAFRRQIP